MLEYYRDRCRIRLGLLPTRRSLNRPNLFNRDKKRGESLLKERAHAATALVRAEAAWLEASEALESA